MCSVIFPSSHVNVNENTEKGPYFFSIAKNRACLLQQEERHLQEYFFLPDLIIIIPIIIIIIFWHKQFILFQELGSLFADVSSYTDSSQNCK